MEARTGSGEGGAVRSAGDVGEREVLEALRGIQYGSIEITLHDGRIVQIERREKMRIRNDATDTRGNHGAS